jgi:putative transposase
MRKVQFANNQYYHIFNRGVDKRDVFVEERDYQRFYLSLTLMNDEKNGLMIGWRNYKESHSNASVDEFLRLSLSERKKLVEIVSFCLNPNHYHFILEQILDRGIEKFMHRIATGYTRYFNDKYHRSGSLFQGVFKAYQMKSNSQLLRMLVYVGCNSEIHGLCSAVDYKWCSFSEYFMKKNKQLCNTKIISSHFRNDRDYQGYAKENIADFREVKEDEKSILLE